MAILRIDIISNECGDWKGLYINNTLVTEGHTIEHKDLLGQLAKHFPIEYCTTNEVEGDMLPANLNKESLK